MAYDVGSYSPGDGHQDFGAPGDTPAAPAPAVAPAPAAPVPTPAPAPVVAPEPEVEPDIREDIEQPPEAASEPAEPLALAIPAYVSLAEQTDERMAYVSEWAQVAADLGLESKHPGLAQAIVDQVAECASALQYQAPDEYVDSDDATATMHRMFGTERGAEIIKSAQATVKALGPAVADYLDRTNLGNDVAVLVSLAQVGNFNLSPEAAQTELDKTMRSKEYAAGDTLSVLKVHALSRVVHGKTPLLLGRDHPLTRPLATAIASGQYIPSHDAQVGSKAQSGVGAAAKDELAGLAKTKGQMTRAEADRFMVLTKQLSGGGA